MVVKEEQNKVECSSGSKHLQNEVAFSDNDSNVVNGDEVIKGFKDISDELGGDSNSTNIQDSAGSDTGEIDEDDSSSKDPEKLSESEAGEIDKEEPCDVEEGEISESAEKKPVCRFFIRGNCYYGSQCQFLHVFDKVYKMFDLQTSSNVSNNITPSLLPHVSLHLLETSSSWESGLKTAKAMIQDSIKKRNQDTEFENKKLYISPEGPKSNKIYSREKELGSKCRKLDEKAFRAEPVKDLKETQERRKEKTSKSNKDGSHSEYKWVDPWMRSNKKDSKTHTSKRKHRRHSSISSTSSLDDFDINPKQSPKKRLARMSSPRNSRSRSYSRSRSSSRTRVSYSHNHSRKNSPSYRKPKRCKTRRSSSLEKWYKKEVSTARHSCSPSCSSLDSFQSYESSMTISSLSCSQTSSSSSSPNEKSLKHTERDKKSLDSNFSDSFPPLRVATSSIKNIQSYIRGKQKDLNQKDVSLKQRVVSPKQNQNAVPVVKSSNKPLVKLPPKKNNLALRELLKYTNIKPKATGSVTSNTTVQQASKFQDLDSSTSDCKGVVSVDPRRNITLNLQASKSLRQKIPEVQTKQLAIPELSNKEVISKKESLLKQLRLVEQAIARKKNSC